MAAIRCWLLHNYTPSRHFKSLTFIWSHVSCHLPDTEAFILLSALFWSQPCDLLPKKKTPTKNQKRNSREDWTVGRVHQSNAARSWKRFLCYRNTKMLNENRSTGSAVCPACMRAGSETVSWNNSCTGKSKDLIICMLLMVEGPAVIAFAE